MASALNEAKLYLDAHKAADSGSACRQKFVILITDGQDTFACNGNGTDTQSDMYKRRKASVKAAKALKDAGYKVFVVGFGANMPNELKNTLNWMAYYAGTDNPAATKSGNTSAITPSPRTPVTKVAQMIPGMHLFQGMPLWRPMLPNLAMPSPGLLISSVTPGFHSPHPLWPPSEQRPKIFCTRHPSSRSTATPSGSVILENIASIRMEVWAVWYGMPELCCNPEFIPPGIFLVLYRGQ